MQTTVKKSDDSKHITEKSKREKTSKDDSTKKTPDEKLKKGPYTITTPRNFVQKSTTADIYGQKKRTDVHSAKAPMKPSATTYTARNVSPMKDLLKSSPSSSSLTKTKIAARKMDAKVATYISTPRNNIFSSKNSPIAKRKLNLDREKSFVKEIARGKSTISTGGPAISTGKSAISTGDRRLSAKDSGNRQRTKTRTLDENEVKILTPEAVDNNAGMMNLTKTLTANPKAFYIDLDGEHSNKTTETKPPKDSGDDEISYEDDFESYESDFDSYHSSSPSDKSGDGEQSGDDDEAGLETSAKEIKDEERMLDSGNFDLREQRSAQKSKPAVMDFIQEASEDAGEDKRVSLTDEGFQEMSSSSAVSSIRTEHVDVPYRPLFIDFSKSKENKRIKRINERLKQRAKDLLSIISLHEMSYNLFEMKPISYDLYMATFGRSNYTQIAVQTFDDGITQEVQTDEVESEQKWTQYPVEFSNSDICLSGFKENRKYSQNTEDFLTKFTFLTRQTTDVEMNNIINLDENYKMNPLRVYLEQKDGVGPNEMLPYETYKTKLVENKYNTHRLGKFLKRIESRISHILNSNMGNSELADLTKVSKFPFSKGYVSISTKNIKGDKLFLKNTTISQVYFSDTKSNLFVTVHRKDENVTVKNCIISLWDISVARQEPLKILTAIDDVVIGRFRGSIDGFFVAALEDCSIHLWDLSEEPIWRYDVASIEKTTKLVEKESKNLPDINRENSQECLDQNEIHCALQACAFTSSADNMSSGVAADRVVGLQLVGDSRAATHHDGRKAIGQVVSLQRTGVLTTWTIVQDKSKKHLDIGKAFSSKMKLERSQIITLFDYIDAPLMEDAQNGDNMLNFNLNSAKRRLLSRKQEKSKLEIDNSRPKSAVSSDFEFDIGRPASARKKVLPMEKNVLEKWESGIVCYDLKIMCWRNDNNYLVARNCGEVMCCKKNIGSVKVDKICVASDMSSVICIEISPHGLPYYLAATDSGTINLCSLIDNRVLLTLDCRNIPNQDVEKCRADHKGRFISSVQTRFNLINIALGSKMSLTSLSWSRVNPCCLFATLDGAVVAWELTHSDIYAKYACEGAQRAVAASDNTLAILTMDGDVQIHRLTNEQRTNEYLHVFEKYIALL